jgi:hypothetical protein
MSKHFVSLVAVLGVCVFLDWSTAGEPAPPTVRVAQDGSGDFQGSDETPVLEAIDRVGASGGVIVIEPGRYLIRRPLSLPSKVVLRGTAETVLQLPSPVVVTAPATKGQQVVSSQRGPSQYGSRRNRRGRVDEHRREQHFALTNDEDWSNR